MRRKFKTHLPYPRATLISSQGLGLSLDQHWDFCNLNWRVKR